MFPILFASLTYFLFFTVLLFTFLNSFLLFAFFSFLASFLEV